MDKDYLLKWLIGIFEWGIVFPAAIICMAPVTKWMKISPKKLFIIVFSLLFAVCIILPPFEIERVHNPNSIFSLLLLVLLAAYFSLVRLSKLKLLYLLSFAICALSFGGISNHLFSSLLNPGGHSYDTSGWGLLIQWIISLGLTVFTLVSRKKIIWVFENFNDKLIWKTAWLAPAIITVCNVSMIPENYSTMAIGRVLSVSLVVFITLLLLFLYTQTMFYTIARVSADKAETEQKAQLLRMQASQYEAMRSYMQESSRQRHDFRQSVRTMNGLAKSGDFDELCSYLNEFEEDCDIRAPQSFCRCAPLNALLNYYSDLASNCGIKNRWQINLTPELPISDTDLTVIFGNLLENAVQACEKVSPERRFIYITADTDSPGCLYIVMNNSFYGELKKSKKGFLSTKATGSEKGIGLSSVAATAEKYGGVAKFSAEDGNFSSRVLLHF